MNRSIPFAEGEYYHIYNRGVEMRDVFMEEGDYLRFQRMLFYSNGDRPVIYRYIKGDVLDDANRGKPLCAIGAYVLMPNHFHLLVRANSDIGISEFLQKLTTGYTMYFNKKRHRVGALFQGAFKAEHVGRDEYLKYLFAYIHLNPIKLIEPTWKVKGIQKQANAKKYLDGYQYSSYADYALGVRRESAILSPKEFPEYFEDRSQFDEYINDWLSYQGETLVK